jgi:protein-disulfide isomerase
MASRTKQKEEARARRLAEERQRAERARRERRLRMIGGTVLLAIAVVAVGIAISSGGGGATGLQKGKQQNSTVSGVSSLFNGIPQSGAVLGDPKAPVTMTYYGDLECPICAQFTVSGGFPQLVANQVRQGKVKVLYKNYQSATSDATVFKTQQVAALAAGKQNKFWNFADLFYHEQGQEGSGYVTEGFLQSIAKQVPGLNLDTWEADRNNASLDSQIAADLSAGNKLGVPGTPTLIFNGPKGNAAITSGVPSYSELQQYINKVA